MYVQHFKRFFEIKCQAQKIISALMKYNLHLEIFLKNGHTEGRRAYNRNLLLYGIISLKVGVIVQIKNTQFLKHNMKMKVLHS